MATSFSVNDPLSPNAAPIWRLDGPAPRLLANRWLVIAQDGTICAVRAHLYAAQRPGFDPRVFLRSRAQSDWRVARQFGPPEFEIDRLALELELGPERTAALYPPGPPITANHEKFKQDPELLFSNAMTRLVGELPDGYFVEDDEPYIYYSSVMLRASRDDDELTFLDRRDARFPKCVSSPFTFGP